MTLQELDEEECRRRLQDGDLLLKIGPFTFAIKSPPGMLLPMLRSFYGRFPVLETDDFAEFQLCLTKAQRFFGGKKSGVSVFADGRSQFERFAVEIAPVMLEWTMNRCIFMNVHRYLILHAATVARGDEAVMIVGKSGAGKSTLCAGLVAHGWRLLSDEFALIDLQTLLLTPLPRPIALKNESIEVIATNAGLRMGPSFPGTPKGTIAHAFAPDDSVANVGVKATPRLIVFPGYGPGADLEIRQLNPAKALIQIVRSGFNYVALQSRAFNALCELVDQCPAFHATYSDLGQVIGAIEKHLPERVSPRTRSA